MFSSCDLVSEFSIIIPDGLCFNLTAVSTLFTPCPPAPPARKVSQLISDGLILISMLSSTKGYTNTEANVVCLFAFESNGDILTNLCTPFSLFKFPNA